MSGALVNTFGFSTYLTGDLDFASTFTYAFGFSTALLGVIGYTFFTGSVFLRSICLTADFASLYFGFVGFLVIGFTSFVLCSRCSEDF